jgi:hypothetical protein
VLVRVGVGVAEGRGVPGVAEHGPCAPTSTTMSAAVVAPSPLTSALLSRVGFPPVSPATAWITADRSAVVTCPSPLISARHGICAAQAPVGRSRHHVRRPATKTMRLDPLAI